MYMLLNLKKISLNFLDRYSSGSHRFSIQLLHSSSFSESVPMSEESGVTQRYQDIL